LNARGVNTKRWRTRTGKLKGGKAVNRNAIYTRLKNRVYLGEVFTVTLGKKARISQLLIETCGAKLPLY